jgi:hypothetical protein
VYATITMMSVLIIYDGWQKLKLIDVVLVMVGPIIAMFIGHVFSAALAKQIEVGRPLSRSDAMPIVGSESRFLLLAVPPVAIVSVLYAFNVSLTEAIQVILWAEAASLGYWGFVAARRAGIVGWRVVAFVVAGSLLEWWFYSSKWRCNPARPFPEALQLDDLLVRRHRVLTDDGYFSGGGVYG